MPDTAPSPGNELRFRDKFFYIGCFVNCLLFAALAAVCVVFLFATVRTFDRESKPTSADENAIHHTPADDEAAIRRVLNDQVVAWNKGDLDGFMAGYWRDEGLTFTSGDNVEHGWDATRARYLKKYFTPNAKGKLAERGQLSFEKLEVESLGANVAIVRGRFVLKLSNDTATGRFTLVFRRFADGWKITSDHTSAAEKK